MGFEDCLEVYENCVDQSKNKLRLRKPLYLFFFQFYCKIKRIQLEIVVETTYALNPYQYFQILNLKV